jgi:hypothetical protein
MNKKATGTATKVSEATRERANSKLRYQAQYLNRLLESIQDFHADASEEARAEAKPDLQRAAQTLNAFLTE